VEENMDQQWQNRTQPQSIHGRPAAPLLGKKNDASLNTFVELKARGMDENTKF
jgi:hypothetical protein